MVRQSGTSRPSDHKARNLSSSMELLGGWAWQGWVRCFCFLGPRLMVLTVMHSVATPRMGARPARGACQKLLTIHLERGRMRERGHPLSLRWESSASLERCEGRKRRKRAIGLQPGRRDANNLAGRLGERESFERVHNGRCSEAVGFAHQRRRSGSVGEIVR